MRRSWIIVLSTSLATGLLTGCAAALEGPPELGTATPSEEHLAAMAAIPVAAVRLLEGPALALDHWEYLDLSVDQLRRLEDLDLWVERGRAVLLLDMEAARQELTDALESPFDETRLRAALDKVAAGRTESSLLTLRAREATLALLTAEQASLLDLYAREHVHMMMMGWVTEICSGVSAPAGVAPESLPNDALFSDVTGAMTPCIAMPESQDGVGDDFPPHVHQE